MVNSSDWVPRLKPSARLDDPHAAVRTYITKVMEDIRGFSGDFSFRIHLVSHRTLKRISLQLK
jgi:hypothetical protein